MMSMWPKSGGPYVSQLGTDFRDERTVLSTCFHNHPHSASFKQDELIQTLRVALKKSLGTLSEPIVFVFVFVIGFVFVMVLAFVIVFLLAMSVGQSVSPKKCPKEDPKKRRQGGGG